MIKLVQISSAARKQLRKVPAHVVDKLLAWVLLVENRGLDEGRRVPGYHDEPLKGKRKGQRSIRLTRAYRAIYRILRDGSIEFVIVEEVSKHGY